MKETLNKALKYLKIDMKYQAACYIIVMELYMSRYNIRTGKLHSPCKPSQYLMSR